MDNTPVSSIASTAAVFAVMTLVPIIWRFVQRNAENHPGRPDEIFKDDHVFREPPWLGFLFGTLALGLPVAVLSYVWRFPDWHFYGLMGLIFGFMGAGGLAEYAWTSVRVENGKVCYQGLLRRFSFDLAQVRSAWIAGQYIIVDVGEPLRLVLPSLLDRAGLLVSVLNRGQVDMASQEP